MNLLLNVNENLYSVKSSVDGEKKIQAAIDEAMYDIKLQVQKNIERKNKGLKPQPYKTSVLDEYGKEIVSIKETKSLLEIRNNYNKNLEKLSYEKREENLLSAMNEIGNSYKIFSRIVWIFSSFSCSQFTGIIFTSYLVFNSSANFRVSSE